MWVMKLLIHSKTSTATPLKLGNVIPHITGYVITYPCWNQSSSMLVKGAPDVEIKRKETTGVLENRPLKIELSKIIS